MTFTQLSREALEEELRRCNDLLSEDGKKISNLTEQRDRLCHALVKASHMEAIHASAAANANVEAHPHPNHDESI